MSTATTIEWTNATWNPVRGCAIVSKGCTNCYAMRQAHRFSAPGGAYAGLTQLTKGGPVWTGKVTLHPELLHQPWRWKKPRRIFVNSMSDLFHEDVPDDFIAQVWFTMACTQQHTFQILTKRPQRMLEWLTRHGQNAVFAGEEPEYQESLKRHGWPLRNVWLGVSVEDQASADERIPWLLQTPATVRWISAEPLLGPVRIERWLPAKIIGGPGEPTLEGLDWVVAGGESGHGARPTHPDWIRALRDQCAAAGVPFFFKQWGAWAPMRTIDALTTPGRGMLIDRTGALPPITAIKDLAEGKPNPSDFIGRVHMKHVGKRAAGRLLDGRTHDAYPAW